jgi:hypothetical protein
VDTALALHDALTLDLAEVMCIVNQHIKKHQPVSYREYGPGSLFGSGFDTNIAYVFGFESPEDAMEFADATSKITKAIEALELSGVVTVQKALVREEIKGRTTKPAEYDVTVSAVV